MALDSLTDTTVEPVCGQELRPGTALLSGDYRVIGTLSSGGFGIIYLAKDALDRVVVLKECFPSSLCHRDGAMVRPLSPETSTRFDVVLNCFRNEAQVLAMLSHPNIVRVHHVFEDNGTAYMAMDRLHGTDLLDVIEHKTRSFTPAEVVDIARKLIGTVGHLHRNGLVHADLSPDNIVLTPAGEPVLIDFGASRAITPQPGQTYAGPRVVKDGYSPQEQYLSGARLDRTSDLYALAASLYHLITGALPPNADLRLAALEARRTDPCTPLAGSFAGYPTGFLESIDRAMAILPSARFARAEDWLAALTPQTVRLAVRPEKPVLLIRRAVQPIRPVLPRAALRVEHPLGV